ncbi:kunitz-type protease inhibitor 2 isoform X2 [Scyliorhinus canicula]|uniref:kunitz-type protease inhibitor 2 isoform X2 n=1 Tax=Scyliorhinus canicula TaxID=7830 RepID=UPI0018F43FEF|nr:kunitz-type protease inhibitor 2 isoform X2 [Scyliorhinus canicula]
MAQSWCLWLVLAILFLASASSDPSLQTCTGSYNLSKDLSLHDRSFEDGARLLAVSLVNNSLSCLEQCCGTQGCDLALLEEGAELTCFLVNCLSSHKTVCTFTPRQGYQTNSRFAPILKSNDPFAHPKADCTRPSLTGPCRASFQRWFYDAASKTCKIFFYGGCLGNGNNFNAEAECLERCDGVSVNAVTVSTRNLQSLKDCTRPCSASDFRCGDGCCVSRNRLCDGTSQCSDKSDVRYCKAVHDSYVRLTGHQGSSPLDNEQCNAPKKVGNCRAAFPRWYFDTQTQTCTKFMYGGCKGNKNNYESEQDCIATCAGHQEILPEPHKLQGKDDDEAFCYAVAVTGKCRAAFPRWYYDSQSQSCNRFTYGGCGGNKNNYESHDACLARCSGKTAILMVVLLSICILILLAGVIYFIVRLTKTDHVVSYQRAPRGEDKETLISNVQNL